MPEKEVFRRKACTLGDVAGVIAVEYPEVAGVVFPVAAQFVDGLYPAEGE